MEAWGRSAVVVCHAGRLTASGSRYGNFVNKCKNLPENFVPHTLSPRPPHYSRGPTSLLRPFNLWRAQDALADKHPTNPLLQVRGNAGTHDLALGLRTIRGLARGGSSSRRGRRSSNEVHRPSAPASAIEGAERGDEQEEGEMVVRVPRYDKSARGGKGDRAPEGEWGVVNTPLDIVLLEGWMLGFEALPDDSPLLREAAGEAEEGARICALLCSRGALRCAAAAF